MHNKPYIHIIMGTQIESISYSELYFLKQCNMYLYPDKNLKFVFGII